MQGVGTEEVYPAPGSRPVPDLGRGRLEQVWLSAARGEDGGVWDRLLIFLLIPLECLYRAGLAVYLWLERIGVRRRTVLPVSVVSVGNLTLGGTGKTGVVETLARRMNESMPVAVLLRGYGGDHSRGALVVSDRRELRAGWKQSGDEPALLAGRLPGVAVIAGKDRRITGRLAVADFDSKLLILDDGLQYWQLARDVDIVLVDARNPFGNGHVLPAGILREPVGALGRAGAVVLTHTNEMPLDAISEVEKTIRRIAPGKPVFHAFYKAGSILLGGGEEPAGALRGRDVVVLCGIGSPQSFAATLREEGARVADALCFPDHHPFRQADLDLAESRRSAAGAAWVMTTGKDYVRMDELRVPDSLRVLRAEMVIPRLDELLAMMPWGSR